MRFIHEKVWQGSKPGLSRTRELLEKMGDPQKSLRFVHVAGTNGKGSVSAMLASILRAAGYTTGLYTSPFIARFNERMQVNGVPITDAELADITAFFAAICVVVDCRGSVRQGFGLVVADLFHARHSIVMDGLGLLLEVAFRQVGVGDF